MTTFLLVWAALVVLTLFGWARLCIWNREHAEAARHRDAAKLNRLLRGEFR